MITTLAIVACGLALLPGAVFLANLPLYRRLPPATDASPRCSLLIPARNEERNIARAVESALTSEGVDLEVIVLDDGSTDRTATIIREIATRDPRVRLEAAPPPPPGWSGKAFACHQLASLATHPLLVFLDADVSVTRPDSLRRLAQFVAESGADLVSSVPRQRTITLMETLVVPLIHFVLLGFLPLRRMRAGTDPRFAAACGQLIAVQRAAYEKAGGHSAVKDRLHDGPALARAFRAKGLRTDLFDATDTFECRMYRSAAEVWNGFSRNAHEALAAPALIGPTTVLLLGGQVLPIVLLALAPTGLALAAAAVATVAIFLPRAVAVARFRQSPLAALLHPVGICVLLAIQWRAFFRVALGRKSTWKGRAYSPAPTS